MKVKSKKRSILCCCISLILLLLLAAVYFFQFTGLGYRMTVPYRRSFEKATDNIYVNKNYSGNIKEAIQLTEEALERDSVFFGELQCTDTTIIIICDDDKLLSKLGGDHDTKTALSALFDMKKNYISVSDAFISSDGFYFVCAKSQSLTASILYGKPVQCSQNSPVIASLILGNLQYCRKTAHIIYINTIF